MAAREGQQGRKCQKPGRRRVRPPRPAAACGVTGAASPGSVPLPPVAACAAPGGQARCSCDVGSLAAGSRGWNRGWRWDCRSCSVAGVELSGPAGLREMAPIAATLPAAEHGGYGAWPAHWRRARSASRLGWRAHAGGLANLAAAIHGGHAHLVAGRAIGRRAARAGLGPAAPLTRPATLRPLSLPLWLGSCGYMGAGGDPWAGCRRAGGGRWCSASVGAIGRFLAGGGLTGSRTASLRCRSTRAPNFFGIHSDAVIRAHRPPAGP